MEEQLSGELARITQQIQGMASRREQLIEQSQQLTTEIVRLQGEQRLAQRLLTQLNTEAEADISAEIIEEE